jgi:hypothetical protein
MAAQPHPGPDMILELRRNGPERPSVQARGLPLIDGVAMGIGAMTAMMLRLPLTSVLLATLLPGTDSTAPRDESPATTPPVRAAYYPNDSASHR